MSLNKIYQSTFVCVSVCLCVRVRVRENFLGCWVINTVYSLRITD